MIGILVQLLLSWLIIWVLEKRSLSVLGLYPTKKRLTGFAVFFLVTAFFCFSDVVLKMYFAKQRWQLNPELSANLILSGIWWNIKSVLFEELIFRAVLLYILIKRLGSLSGIIISAVAFGIYHWFSHEVIGNPAQMAITFFTTGAMGLLYAYGYAKTYSLYIPCAIHLGWNLTSSVIFSQTVIGNQLFIAVKPAPVVTVSYTSYFFMLLFPILGALLANFLLLKKMRQVSIAQ